MRHFTLKIIEDLAKYIISREGGCYLFCGFSYAPEAPRIVFATDNITILNYYT